MQYLQQRTLEVHPWNRELEETTAEYVLSVCTAEYSTVQYCTVLYCTVASGSSRLGLASTFLVFMYVTGLFFVSHGKLPPCEGPT